MAAYRSLYIYTYDIYTHTAVVNNHNNMFLNFFSVVFTYVMGRRHRRFVVSLLTYDICPRATKKIKPVAPVTYCLVTKCRFLFCLSSMYWYPGLTQPAAPRASFLVSDYGSRPNVLQYVLGVIFFSEIRWDFWLRYAF